MSTELGLGCKRTTEWLCMVPGPSLGIQPEEWSCKARELWRKECPRSEHQDGSTASEKVA